MKNLWEHVQNVEPARAFLFIRIVAYLLAGTGVAFFDPESIESILPLVAAMMGVDAATTEATRRKVSSPRTASELVAQVFVGKVGTLIRGMVERTVPQSKWAEGLSAALPILTEYGGSQLTPDVRAAIQTKVDKALLNAGLVQKRTWGPGAAGMLILLAFTLSACAVVQDVGSDTADYILGDLATLTATPDGTLFDPVDGEADGVVVNIVGAQILGEDPRCGPTDVAPLEGVSCDLGDDITTPTLVTVGAIDGYASATYTRPDSAWPYRISLE